MLCGLPDSNRYDLSQRFLRPPRLPFRQARMDSRTCECVGDVFHDNPHASVLVTYSRFWSGRPDLNWRPPRSRHGALTRLRHALTSLVHSTGTEPAQRLLTAAVYSLQHEWISLENGAVEETRTPTRFPSQAPQACASTVPPRPRNQQ